MLDYSRQHVFYEFDMLFWATWIPGRVPLAGDPGHVQRAQNALVEAFPVHLRNVIEFLYCGTPHGTPTPDRPNPTYRGEPRDTDVAAKDFFPNLLWTPPQPMTALLVEAHRRADCEVGHLTSSRLAANERARPWDPAIMLDLLPTMRHFVRTADPARLARNVRDLVVAHR